MDSSNMVWGSGAISSKWILGSTLADISEHKFCTRMKSKSGPNGLSPNILQCQCGALIPAIGVTNMPKRTSAVPWGESAPVVAQHQLVLSSELEGSCPEHIRNSR